MDAVSGLRFVAGGLVLFVLPGLAWALAAKPRLARDPAALAFWTLSGSAALLVLYGTALGLLGRFTAPWIVGVALAVAAAGVLARLLRAPEVGRDADPSVDFRERLVALRRLKVADVMLRKAGRRDEAAAKRAEAREVEADARRELHGR